MQKILIAIFLLVILFGMCSGTVQLLDIGSISRAKADEIRQAAIDEAVRNQTNEQMRLLEHQAKTIKESQEIMIKQQANATWVSMIPTFAFFGSIAIVLLCLALVILAIKKPSKQDLRNRNGERIVYIQQPPQYYQIPLQSQPYYLPDNQQYYNQPTLVSNDQYEEYYDGNY